ncbi:MAG: NAD(P)-dependent oxidoreductase [Puniceicoccaceae bacterium]
MSKTDGMVTVVGLGIIGEIWANHYAEGGLLAASWNRTPKPGLPKLVGKLEDGIFEAGVIHVCVADPKAVEAVLERVVPKLTPNHGVIQSSTIGPADSRVFEKWIQATGAWYLEAPFTGSRPAAEAKKIVFYAGGLEAAFEGAAPYLEVLAGRIFRFGSGEQAAALKLAMNLQIAAISTALTEGWHLAKAYGLDDDAFFEALAPNVAHSGLADLKEPMLRSGEVSPMFSVKHMRKDLGLALAAARDLNLSQTERTLEIYQRGIEQGLGELDFIALEKLVGRKDG